MLSPRVKSFLVRGHRWLALGLTPVVLAVVLSGAVLAVKPMLPASPPIVASPGDLAQRLAAIDPEGRAVSVASAEDGNAFVADSPESGSAGLYSAHTGAKIGDLPFDVFAFAKSLHVGLLTDAKFLVEAVSWSLAALILVGPLLAWPRRRNTLRGWHVMLGWIGFPLLALGPVSAVLLTLHVGRPEVPKPQPAAEPRVEMSLATAIGRFAAASDAEGIVSARKIRGGDVLVVAQIDADRATYRVHGMTVLPAEGGKGLVSEIHEGTWAGPWSAGLNLAAALAIVAMTATGWASWYRVQKRKAATPPATPADTGSPLAALPASPDARIAG